MLNILSTTNMSEKHRNRLSKQFPQHRFIYAVNPEEGRSALPEADVLVTFGGGIREYTVKEALRLKWMHIMSAGVDRLPFDQLINRQILITNVRGIHAIQMAEYTFAVLLQIVRRMQELAEAERQKRWEKRLRITELWGQTLGIIGVGAIGKEIARRAKVFGMRTVGVNTDGRAVDDVDEVYATRHLEQALQESDFVILTVPLVPSTRHLIGRRALDAMKDSAYLINIARGPVVDEQALIDALEQKRIAGAVLDVFDEEPLPTEHPFWTMDNVIVTPHISGLSPMYMTRAVDVFIENLMHYSAGEIGKMQNVIDPKKQY